MGLFTNVTRTGRQRRASVVLSLVLVLSGGLALSGGSTSQAAAIPVVFVFEPATGPAGTTFIGHVETLTSPRILGCTLEGGYTVFEQATQIQLAQGIIPANPTSPPGQPSFFGITTTSTWPVGIYNVKGLCDGGRVEGGFEITADTPPPPPPGPPILFLSADDMLPRTGRTVTLTATVSDSGTGATLPNSRIRFQILSGPNATSTGTCSPVDCLTGPPGVVRWSYTGSQPGDDTVVAWFDANDNGVLDPDEAQANETISWHISTDRYVALGDSYSAGEGAIDAQGNVTFEAATQQRGINECHRSTAAYAHLVKATNGILDKNFRFRACSGAILADIVSPVGGIGQWNEGPQLDAIEPPGVSDPNVKIITLSIGGNDFGFAQALQDCISVSGLQRPRFPFRFLLGNFLTESKEHDNNCVSSISRHADAGSELLIIGGDIRVDTRNGTWTFCRTQCPRSRRQFVSTHVPRLADVLQLIHTRAPSATIHVLAYPHLFTDQLPVTPQAADGFCNVAQPVQIGSSTSLVPPLVLSSLAISKLNEAADRLDGTIAGQVRIAQGLGLDVDLVDPRADFADHGVHCNSTTINATPWINGASVTGFPPGPSPFSFHPNALGQEDFAKLIPALP
jgi:hypothetical protein